MYEFFNNIDRRWIFLMMFIAVAIPILADARFPEKATGLAQTTFDEVEKLAQIEQDTGRPARVLLAWD